MARVPHVPIATNATTDVMTTLMEQHGREIHDLDVPGPLKDLLRRYQSYTIKLCYREQKNQEWIQEDIDAD